MLLQKWISTVMKFRYFVFLGWIALTVAGLMWLPDLKLVSSQAETRFLPSDAEPMQAQAALDRIDPEHHTLSNAVLVLHRDNGLTPSDETWLNKKLDDLLQNRAKLGIVNIASFQQYPQLKKEFLNQAGTTELAVIGFPQAENMQVTQDSVDQIKRNLQDAPQGAVVHLTGSAPIVSDFQKASVDGLHKTELLTIALVLGILLVVFRSPIAPLIPLLTIGVSLMISRGLVAYAAERFGMPVSSFTESFLMAILAGAGTDYSILLIHRYREQLSNGFTPAEALAQAVKRTAKTVVFSGLTVLLAFSIIGFAKFGMYRSAVGVSIGMAVTLLSVLSFTIALMAILGPKLFWPIRTRVGKGHADSPFWSRFGQLVSKRPAVILLITLVVLAPLTAFFQGKRSFDDLAEIGNQHDAVAGFRLVEKEFSAGSVLPVTLAVTSKTSMRNPEGLAALEQVSAMLKQVKVVSEVRSAARPTGEQISELTVPNELGQATNALSQMKDAVTQVASGLNDAHHQLSLGLGPVQDLKAGFYQMAGHTQEAQTGLVQITQGLSQSQTGLSGMMQGMNGLQQLNAQIQAEINLYVKSHPDTVKDPDFQALLAQQQALGNGLAQVQSGIAPIQSGISQMVPSLQQMSAGLGQLAESGRQAATGIAGLSSQLDQLNQGLNTGESALQQVSSGMQQIHDLENGIAANGNQQIAGWYLPANVWNDSADLQKGVDSYLSPDGRTAKLEVVLAINPYSSEALQSIDSIRNTAIQAFRGTAVVDPVIQVAGVTSQYHVLEGISRDDFLRTGGLVLLGIYSLVALMLGSLLTPLYLLLSLCLNYLVTMGILELVFVKWLGLSGLSWTVAFFIFLIIVALGVDYSIFLMARFKEEYRPGHVSSALKKAMASTGSVILSAAVIMGGTFGAMMGSGVATLVQIGAGIVIGLTLYATVVMGLLVPSIGMLLGEAGWWPRRNNKQTASLLQPIQMEQPMMNPPSASPH